MLGWALNLGFAGSALTVVPTTPETIGVTGTIKNTISVSSPDISKGQGVSGKITNTIGVSG